MFAQQSCSTMSSSIIMPYTWQGKAWPPSQPSFPEGTGPRRTSGARAPHRASSDRPLAFLPVVFLFSSPTGRETPSRVFPFLTGHMPGASTAQTAHLWSRQLGLRGGPNPSRFTAVAKAAGKIPHMALPPAGHLASPTIFFSLFGMLLGAAFGLAFVTGRAVRFGGQQPGLPQKVSPAASARL